MNYLHILMNARQENTPHPRGVVKAWLILQSQSGTCAHPHPHALLFMRPKLDLDSNPKLILFWVCVYIVGNFYNWVLLPESTTHQEPTLLRSRSYLKLTLSYEPSRGLLRFPISNLDPDHLHHI